MLRFSKDVEHCAQHEGGYGDRELVLTIAENATSCLLMLDDRGIATYMNPSAIEQTGYRLEELARAPFHDVLGR